MLPGKQPQRQLPDPRPLGRGLKPLWPGTAQLAACRCPPSTTMVLSPWDLHPWQVHLWAPSAGPQQPPPTLHTSQPDTKAHSWDWAAQTTSPGCSRGWPRVGAACTSSHGQPHSKHCSGQQLLPRGEEQDCVPPSWPVARKLEMTLKVMGPDHSKRFRLDGGRICRYVESKGRGFTNCGDTTKGFAPSHDTQMCSRTLARDRGRGRATWRPMTGFGEHF